MFDAATHARMAAPRTALTVMIDALCDGRPDDHAAQILILDALRWCVETGPNTMRELESLPLKRSIVVACRAVRALRLVLHKELATPFATHGMVFTSLELLWIIEAHLHIRCVVSKWYRNDTLRCFSTTWLQSFVVPPRRTYDGEALLIYGCDEVLCSLEHMTWAIFGSEFLPDKPTRTEEWISEARALMEMLRGRAHVLCVYAIDSSFVDARNQWTPQIITRATTAATDERIRFDDAYAESSDDEALDLLSRRPKTKTASAPVVAGGGGGGGETVAAGLSVTSAAFALETRAYVEEMELAFAAFVRLPPARPPRPTELAALTEASSNLRKRTFESVTEHLDGANIVMGYKDSLAARACRPCDWTIFRAKNPRVVRITPIEILTRKDAVVVDQVKWPEGAGAVVELMSTRMKSFSDFVLDCYARQFMGCTVTEAFETLDPERVYERAMLYHSRVDNTWRVVSTDDDEDTPAFSSLTAAFVWMCVNDLVPNRVRRRAEDGSALGDTLDTTVLKCLL